MARKRTTGFTVIRTQAKRPADLLNLKKKAEESRSEYEYEDAIAQEEQSVHGDIEDKVLKKLPIDSVYDRVSRLDGSFNLYLLAPVFLLFLTK